MNRGILTTSYTNLKRKTNIEDIYRLYTDYYKNEKFIRILEPGKLPETRFVRSSNFTDIGFSADDRTGRLIVVGVIDNLIKGAAGQAVQNMNIHFNFPEENGLSYVPVTL